MALRPISDAVNQIQIALRAGTTAPQDLVPTAERVLERVLTLRRLTAQLAPDEPGPG